MPPCPYVFYAVASAVLSSRGFAGNSSSSSGLLSLHSIVASQRGFGNAMLSASGTTLHENTTPSEHFSAAIKCHQMSSRERQHVV